MDLESSRFSCPWCMTTNTVELEPQERDQEIVQDCRVCCRPITLVCRTGRDGGIVLEVAREDG